MTVASGMCIALGCDHRGYAAKRKLTLLLQKSGHEVRDLGCDGLTACDYPDYAGAVARAVAAGKCHLGILLDASGIGMSVAANKVPGIRAALVHDHVTARLAREAIHCNVLCIGIDLVNEDQLHKIVETFLISHFTEGRHVRRVNKITQMEAQATHAECHRCPRLPHDVAATPGISDRVYQPA